MSDFGVTSIDAAARHELERVGSQSARWLIFVMASLLFCCLLWAGLAEVEEVVTARGKVEPMGRVQTVNHSTGGQIQKLNVEDGQLVRKGDVLLEFAPEQAEYAQAEIRTKAQAILATIARLRAELEGVNLALPAWLASSRPDLLERERELMHARAESYTSRRTTLQQQAAGKRTELGRAEADVARLSSDLELINQQLTAIQELAERGLYPKLKVIDMQRQANDISGQLSKARAYSGICQKCARDGRGRSQAV